MEQVKQSLDRIQIWADSEYRATVNEGATEIAKDIKEAIQNGQDALGNPLAPLTDATLEAPIKINRSKTPRNVYGNTPLHATGNLANTIVSERIGPDEWEIGANSKYGDVILSSNARRKSDHAGIPFFGDTPKYMRDPVQVSSKQLDIIEDKLVADIIELIG